MRPTFAIAGWIVLLLGGLTFGGAAGQLLGTEEVWVFAGVAVGGVLAILVGLSLRRRMFPAKEAPIILLAGDQLVLPARNGHRIDRVPLDEVLDVEVGRGRIGIATARESYVYSESAFVDPDGASLLASTLLQAIRAGADGERRIAEMGRRRAIGRRAMAKRPIATWTLAGVLCAFFVLEHLLGAQADSTIESSIAMLRLGANSAVLVKDGEWFRLFTANFLHVNLLHIYMNGTALLFLGALLERLLGPSRLLVIYLFSALGGAIGSVLFSRGVFAVGASTAIFGLLGALGALQLRFGKELPSDFRRTKRWWIMIIAINGALPILVPVIDIAGHAGGALAGVAVTFAIVAPLEKLEPGRSAGAVVRALAVVLAAAAIGAFAWCALTPDAGEHAFWRVVDAQEASTINGIAWEAAIERSSTRRDLEIASQLAERAVALSDDVEIRDTLATVCYRRGDYDRAIEIERQVVASKASSVHFSQLARFLAARVARDGPIGPTEVEVTRSNNRLQVTVPEALGPVEVLVLWGAPKRPAGILRFTLEGEREFDLPPGVTVPLTVALVERLPGATESFTYAPRDPAIDELP